MNHFLLPIPAIAALGTLIAPLIVAPVATAAPTADAVAAIDARYHSLGADHSRLGAPAGDVVDVAGGAERDYAGGAIFYSPQTGATVLYGAIADRYRALGGPAGKLGFPAGDETDAGNGIARVADFTEPGGAAIYWSPQWGAALVDGPVLRVYRASGGAIGPFSYPRADTTTVGILETGTFIGPRGTQIQWSESGGLSTVPSALAATLPSPGDDRSPIRTSRWWWIPATLAVVLAAASSMRALCGRRRTAADPLATPPAEPPARPVISRALFTHDESLSAAAPR